MLAIVSSGVSHLFPISVCVHFNSGEYGCRDVHMWRPKVNFGSSFLGTDNLVSVRQTLMGLELPY